MGEIADLVLEGAMCQECGELFDDDSPGYPRSCAGCAGEKPQLRSKKRGKT